MVFTLPEPIAALAFYNQEVVYEILFRATAQTLLSIAADPERLGVLIEAVHELPKTATRKVKRRLMLERYHDLVESMFGSDEERRIGAEVAALEKES